MGNECKEVCVSQRWLNFSIVLKIMASSKRFCCKVGVLVSYFTKNRLRSQRHLSLTYSNIVCKVLI